LQCALNLFFYVPLFFVDVNYLFYYFLEQILKISLFKIIVIFYYMQEIIRKSRNINFDKLSNHYGT